MFGLGEKKYSATPWKTKDGTYKCQVSICPPDFCHSGKCPLELQTRALEGMEMGLWKQALDLLTHAVAIDSGCAQIWCNIGSCYGNLGDHARARDAFRTAIRLRPGYPDAVKGLETAERALCGGNGNVSSVRYMEVLDELLELAVKKGDMREKAVKHVPELMPYADGFSDKLIPALRKDAVKHQMGPNLIRDYFTVILWSMYAGFGAVLEWDRDWPALKRTGLLEKLTKERGVYAMDEYVAELYTGEEYDTDAGVVPQSCKDFSDSMAAYATIAQASGVKAFETIDDDKKKLDYLMANLPELTKGCYLFGMALALDKLGL